MNNKQIREQYEKESGVKFTREHRPDDSMTMQDAIKISVIVVLFVLLLYFLL